MTSLLYDEEGAETKEVLLIEDNEQHQLIISRFLHENAQLNFVSRSNLAEGIEYGKRHDVSLILLDLSLPDSNGIETFNRANSSFADTPIIVLTALEDSETARRLIGTGAQDFLCKSEITGDILERAIEGAIQRKRIEIFLKKESRIKENIVQISKTSLESYDLESLLDFIFAKLLEDRVGDAIVFCQLDPSTKTYELLKSSVPMELSNSPSSFDTGNLDAVPSIDRLGSFRYGQSFPVKLKGDSSPIGFLGIYSKDNSSLEQNQFYISSIVNILACYIQRFNLEKSLREKIAELDNTNRKKDEFLSIISHELRTPLSVITNSLEILEGNTLSPEKYSEIFDIIKRNVKQEEKLVEDILDASRIVNSQLRIRKRYFNITELIKNIIDSVSYSARLKGIMIQLQNLEKDTLVWGDRDRLSQVFRNLLSNAVKYTKDGGKIDVELHKRDSRIEVIVQDNGVGIPSHFIPYVFEKFRQSDDTLTRSKDGLGLGLSIAKYIVVAHGGSISCESSGPNTGSKFTVELPILKESQESLPSDLSTDEPAVVSDHLLSEKSSYRGGQLKGLRIMVVDDSVDGLTIYTYCLEEEGATVVPFSDAETALKAYSENVEVCDLIISDIGLPIMDGFTFMENIRRVESSRKLARRIPSIALTAFARVADRKNALKSGFDFYIKKPVTSDVLVRKILNLISKYEMRQ